MSKRAVSMEPINQGPIEEFEIHKGIRIRVYTDKEGYATMDVLNGEDKGYRQRVMPGSTQAKSLLKAHSAFERLLHRK